MASFCCTKCAVFLAFILFSHHGAFGEMIKCETLDSSTCAFAVSSSGTRCVLEKRLQRSGLEAYYCRTSEIETENLTDWMESDECVQACGLNRRTVGISSDTLLEPRFTEKLCSPKCYQGCPNIVDLYFNLAAGEGVFLPKLCEAQGISAGRSLAEIRSSGAAHAGGPASSVELACAPTQSEKVAALGPAQPPI